MPRRSLNDREKITWGSIKLNLPTVYTNNGPCKPLWKPNNNGDFSIAPAKKPLFEESNFNIDNINSQAYKNLWCSSIPLKCKFFIWTLFHQSSTMDALQRRNPSNCLSPQWCISCKSSLEDIDNLFIHCTKAQKLWKKSLGNRPWHAYA